MGALPPEPSTSPPPLFHGRYRLKIDAQGRVTLPAIFRRAIPIESNDSNGTLVLMSGPDGYVQALSVQEWEARAARVQQQSDLKGESGRWKRRQLFSGITPCELDEKGRFTLPKELADQAGIEREVLVMGVDRAIELWDPPRYFDLAAQRQQDLSDVEDILF